MGILEVKNVNKRFGGLKALGNVNLSFTENTVHAIIGGVLRWSMGHPKSNRRRPDDTWKMDIHWDRSPICGCCSPSGAGSKIHSSNVPRLNAPSPLLGSVKPAREAASEKDTLIVVAAVDVCIA